MKSEIKELTKRKNEYATMLKLAKKASWRDNAGLCLLVSRANSLVFDPTKFLVVDYPELMIQKPEGKQNYGEYWWPRWNIWKRRKILRKAIKMVDKQIIDLKLKKESNA